ncbi:acyl--CoA ligase [Candidatus Micrarchaeota archaeon]|nr:acyl--CoA ligase [Candidatus Micrarchaeota archaeon]
MSARSDTAEYIKNLFKENWKEKFMFDGLNDSSLTYEEFFGLAISFRDQLKKNGITKDDIVCTLVHNSVELSAFYLASLILGSVAAPIDPTKGKEEITDTLGQVKYEKIISELSDLPILFASDQVINFDPVRKSLQKKSAVNLSELSIFDGLDYDKLFLITFTSGSTGVPKGVMHSFNNLFHTSLAFKSRFNFGKNNIFYHNFSMSYMAGILNLFFLPFISGSSVVLGERFNVAAVMHFWKIPIKYSANTFWLSPTIIALLLKLDRSTEGIDYAKNRNIIACVGTAPLPSHLKISFEAKYKIPLYESYGLSETLFVSSNYPGHDRPDAVGPLLQGVKLDFLTDQEILITVPWMFLGYTNMSTEKFFHDEKYLSGDLGVFENDGFVKITGRKKDLIIRGGFNISPKRIEDFIYKLDIFDEVVIVGLPDPILGEKVVCVFSPKGEHNERLLKVLNSELVQKLGSDYQINQFLMLKEIPKNTNGKTDKPKIRKLCAERLNVPSN